MDEPRSLFIGVANGTYVNLTHLERAVPDTQAVADALANRSAFETEFLADTGIGLSGKLKKILKRQGMVGGRLILSWVGHGEASSHALQLMVPDYENNEDVEYGDMRTLVRRVLDTGARQVLMIIDTCHSGAALGDTSVAVLTGLDDRNPEKEAWFGVVAASQSYQASISGMLIGEVHRLLTKGPGDEIKSLWPKLRPSIDGPDLIKTLIKEWTDSRQTLRQQTIGGWPGTGLVANPRFVAGIGKPLEHLLYAARGSSTDQNFFTGRISALEEIVAWMANATPGLFVMTGPPGCGKSAIVGRIISLASTEERDRILAVGPVPDTADPGKDSVDVQLQFRRVNVEGAVASICDQLGLDGATSSYEVLAEARRRARTGDPLVIVIDGLDEAGDFAWALATELIGPLAREALVLVARRDLALNDQVSLIASLGPASVVIDLGDDPEATKRTVHSYVMARLEGVDAKMDAHQVADVLAGTGSDTSRDIEAPFLFARLVTAQLRAKPVDTSAEDWADDLASSVASALEYDLKSVSIEVGGRPHPTAARELLRAVAHSYGSGFPADVWSRVASALSRSGTQYTRDDVYGAMDTLARHLVVGVEGDQPTYRMAHQWLVDHLRDVTVPTISHRADLVVAEAIADLYEELLSQGLTPPDHPYLWRYAWAHLADADMAGMERHKQLAQFDMEAFEPDLAMGYSLVGARMRLQGRIDDARSAGEQAVAIRRNIGPPVDLATALFDLATTLSGTDPEQASELATEALDIARDHRDKPGGRAAFAQGLTTSALTGLRLGDVRWAYHLANEAVALCEREVAEDPEKWPSLAIAQSLLAGIAVGVGELDIAEKTAQAMLDTSFERDGAELNAFLVDDAVSTLLQVRFRKAVATKQRGKQPALIETDLGETLWSVVQEQGPTKSMADVIRGRGLLFLAQSLVFNKAFGADSPLDVRVVLNASIDLLKPFAAADFEAATILALALESRANQGGDGADVDRSEAERTLRALADQHPMSATQLGALLHQRAMAIMAADQPAPGRVDEKLLDLECDAVVYLRLGAEIPDIPVVLADALTRLALLLLFAEQREKEVVIRDEAIIRCRELHALGVPGSALLLIANLVDQSGRILEFRPIEAVNFGREALDLLADFDDDVPQRRVFFAQAQCNVALGRWALGETDGLREQLEDAIAQLSTPDATPLEIGILASAHTAKAAFELSEGNFEAAREAARAALRCCDTPGSLVGNPTTRIGAELHLGRAERALGRKKGLRRLREVLANLRQATIDGSLPPAALSGMLNAIGDEFWDEALAGLTEHPELIRHLTLYRERPPDQITEMVASLRNVESNLGDLDLRTVRGAIRSRRAEDTHPFDAAWLADAGDLPSWLTIDPGLEHLVIAWWNANDIVSERAFLLEHQDLLSPNTDILIEEFRTEADAAEQADCYLEILQRARRDGVEAAYAPSMAWDLVYRWLDSDDLEQFLDEHPALRGPGVAEVLASELEGGLPASVNELTEDPKGVLAALQAVLFLARRGEQALAFQMMGDVSAELIKHLRESWRSGDAERLEALALIGLLLADVGDRPRRALALGLAIAWAMQGCADQAMVLVGSIGQIDDVERDELTSMITDALTTNPEQGAGLGRLLAAIPKVDGAQS